MRTISVSEVTEAVRKACGEMAFFYSTDILERMEEGRKNERGERSQAAMDMLLQNAAIAREEQIPICQDTGLVTVWINAGQEISFTDGSLKEAVQEGVRRGYEENFLRASVVKDPLYERVNTRDNTPAVIYCDITEGDRLVIELTAKGFGSENMSRQKMLKPSEGEQGVKDFVLETIRLAGPNACPPMIVGVGLGGTFDYSTVLAKHALLRDLSQPNPDERYAKLEEELKEAANQLMIGPMGLHGNTTVLGIRIETAPTHIAGMPCAVNICCHACRHREIRL